MSYYPTINIIPVMKTALLDEQNVNVKKSIIGNFCQIIYQLWTDKRLLICTSKTIIRENHFVCFLSQWTTQIDNECAFIS